MTPKQILQHAIIRIQLLFFESILRFFLQPISIVIDTCLSSVYKKHLNVVRQNQKYSQL